VPETLRNFIGNEYVDARGDDALDLVDPATEEVYGRAPISTAADIDAAYAAASTAFDTWGRTTPAERQLALFRIADAMEERAEEFADLESQDTGKPRATLVADEILQSPAPRATSKGVPRASTSPTTRRSSAASPSA
jgi:betaine-aldehyde dehydrogenase